MTIEVIYYISQIVAVIGIFASLIFVGIQIRQNTRATRASAAFEGTHSWASTNERLVTAWSDEMIVRAVASFDPAKTLSDFSEADRIRLTVLYRALFQKLEGMYFLFKYGSLDKAIWEARLDWAAGTIKVPFYRQWWEFEKTQRIWSKEFVAVIEAARDATKVVPWEDATFHVAGTLAPGATPQSGTVKS